MFRKEVLEFRTQWKLFKKKEPFFTNLTESKTKTENDLGFFRFLNFIKNCQIIS